MAINKDDADYVLSQPPSAIATFSSLIFSMNPEQSSAELSSATTLEVRTTSNPKLFTMGPDALPTEILLSIFQFAYEACVDWNRTGAVYPKHTTVWLEDDPLSPCLFPYSLASVCVRWLGILGSVAAFWTRQVIAVDSHVMPLIAVKTLLRWAGNLPLQLIVTRHPGISTETDRDEQARIRAVLDLLRPHIHQTWSLTFNVRYSSSLPAIWREQGDAQCLRVLTLTSSGYGTSGVTGLPRLPELHTARNSNGYNTSFQARFLEEVTPSGHFFTDSLEVGEQRSLWFYNITSLTIRGSTTPDGGRISLCKFITTIHTCGLLQKLVVEDVAFINDVHPSHRFRLEVPVVFLRNITGGDAVATIMSQTLGIRLKEVVTISNCPFDGFGERTSFRARFFSSTRFILEEMSASTAAIQKLVRFWNGESLSFINCPGVSASFLRGIPTEVTPPDLRLLRIVDCENATAGGLMAFVKAREIQSAIDAVVPGDPDGESCVALVELHVHGRGSPITAEQATWFANHVDTFSWDTVASDGMQYSWDPSTLQLVVSLISD